MSFHLGTAFPRAGFVQAAPEHASVCCERFTAGYADLGVIDREGQRWIIEAKGETTHGGLDFSHGSGSTAPEHG
jgi:hypothetical protein